LRYANTSWPYASFLYSWLAFHKFICRFLNEAWFYFWYFWNSLLSFSLKRGKDFSIDKN